MFNFLRYAFIFVNWACVSNESFKCVFELTTLLGMLTNMLQSSLCVHQHSTWNPHWQTCIFMAVNLCSVRPWPSSPQPHAPHFHFHFPGGQLASRCLESSLAHPRGFRMTPAADIQWLLGFITDVYSVYLGWTLSLFEGRPAQRCISDPSTREPASCCFVGSAWRGCLLSDLEEQVEGLRTQSALAQPKSAWLGQKTEHTPLNGPSLSPAPPPSASCPLLSPPPPHLKSLWVIISWQKTQLELWNRSHFKRTQLRILLFFQGKQVLPWPGPGATVGYDLWQVWNAFRTVNTEQATAP